MKWEEVCQLELLKDAPFKVETDKWGKIEMTPASNEHGMFQTLIATKLMILGEGKGGVVSECSIQTSDGVKVADVAWGSLEFFRTHGRANPYPSAPEICLEVLSPHNTSEEMMQKKELYFARGAREVWICDMAGMMTFYENTGQVESSRLFPEFPGEITIEYA